MVWTSYRKLDEELYNKIIKEAEDAKTIYWGKQGFKPGTDAMSDYVMKGTDFAPWYNGPIKEQKPVEYTLYVIVRNLVSMTNGKAQAHSGHAACAFLHQYAHLPEVKTWQKESGQGFGTQINVIGSDDDTKEFVACAESLGYPAGFVFDPTYPYVVSDEMYMLIGANVHTLPAKYNKEQRRWLCFRSEWTASFCFVDKSDKNIKERLDQFTLSP